MFDSQNVAYDSAAGSVRVDEVMSSSPMEKGVRSEIARLIPCLYAS